MSSYTEAQYAYKESLKGVALSSKNGEVVLQGKKNKYVIKEVIGSGGYAITYKATAKCDVEVKNGNITAIAHDVEMSFAIKEFVMEGCFRADDGRTLVIPHTISQKCDHAKAAFKKEAEILMSLSGKSANIVPVNEYIESNGTCYYVMQYLEGGNLSELGRLPEDKAIAAIKPICRLLEKLHKEYHLLHLDVKPDNIMVTKNSRGRLVPVLIDFGVAKHFDKKGRPTSSHFFQGATQGYAPIEQCSNTQIDQFDSRIEVYSVGATLYYLLTHKDPPDAVKLMNDQSILMKELEKYGVSERTTNAIIKAMKPAREDRVGTPDNAMGPFLTMLGGEIIPEPKQKTKPQLKATDPLEPISDSKVSRDVLVANKNRIVKTLHNYGIEIVGISAKIEPTHTLYEINPAYGSSISKIKSLEDDIARSLSDWNIRIIAPIPDRGTIGIEVSNTISTKSIWHALNIHEQILVVVLIFMTIVVLGLLLTAKPPVKPNWADTINFVSEAESLRNSKVLIQDAINRADSIGACTGVYDYSEVSQLGLDAKKYTENAIQSSKAWSTDEKIGLLKQYRRCQKLIGDLSAANKKEAKNMSYSQETRSKYQKKVDDLNLFTKDSAVVAWLYEYESFSDLLLEDASSGYNWMDGEVVEMSFPGDAVFKRM